MQQGMLKLLEGSEVEVPVGASSKNAMVPMTTVDTRNILFICGGAFPGLEDIIKERLNKEASIGFKADLKDKYDGFERFCEGNLITVFSATDYCKRHQNAGAMLLITNNFEIIPYLIYPVLSGRVKWLDKGDFIKKRPPTPIRKRIKK